MAAEITPEQDEYLRAQRLGAFATGRGDGSPQLSTIMYDYDGDDLVVSVRRRSAKWHNVQQQPSVALLVPDGRRQLIVYGRAEALGHPERLAAMRRINRKSRRRSDEPELDDDALAAQIDEARRGLIRITIERVFMND